MKPLSIDLEDERGNVHKKRIQPDTWLDKLRKRLKPVLWLLVGMGLCIGGMVVGRMTN